jgi:CubicO group peptidase (beta-lactamase class C family)
MKKLRLKPIIVLIIYFEFSFLMSSCGKTKTTYYPDNKWRVSTPEEQGVDSRKLLDMFKFIQTSNLDFHSILIIRNGYLITEAYWAPYNESTTHNIKSASKSIMSALVGIALKNNYLTDLNQKVSEFCPEYVKDSLKKTISLNNLLTMTAGLEWKEDAGPSAFDLNNWNKITMRNKPGELFEYNTMLTHMMSAILTKTTGESTREFANKWLFEPSGIKNYQWAKSTDGIYHGGSDIFLTPLDMAKFGYLFLNNGQWNKKQIVPKEWVKESTSKKVSIPANDSYAAGLNYGYWWWIQEKAYMAWGAGGQYIIVSPDMDLVIVITANGFDKINRYNEFMRSFLENYIYSAVQNNVLPSQPSTLRELNNIIKEIKNPIKVSTDHMLKSSVKISGNIYILEPNAMDFNLTSLTFQNNDNCVWIYYLHEKQVTMQVGLNGNYIINKTDFSMGVRPDGEEIACKGYWKNGNTFIIEHHIIGDPSKQIFEFNFVEKNLYMNFSTFGMNTTIKGIVKKQE